MKSEWGEGGNANDSIENCDWRRARILVFGLNVYIYIYIYLEKMYIFIYVFMYTYIYMCVYAFVLMRLVSLISLVCDVSPT